MRRNTIVALGAAGIATGSWFAFQNATTRFGYAADYVNAGAIVIAIGLVVTGLVLLIPKWTRAIGTGLLAAGILSVATYAGGMLLLLRMDRVAWVHEPPMQRLGPQAKVPVLVYFRLGTTDEQVDQFVYSVVNEGHEGPPADVPMYWRLSPDQANGHQSIALGLDGRVTEQRLATYLGRIRSDPLVEKVYENVAPAEIRPAPDSAAAR